MPRRKRGGSPGPSPDKSHTQGGGGASLDQPQPPFNDGEHTSPPWSNASDHTPPHQDKEEIFQRVNEMFRGKIDSDVVRMVLEENDYKGKTGSN